MEELVGRVRQAVLVQHSAPNSPDFKIAHKFLEEFKQSPQCLPTCLALAKQQNVRDEMRHFAFSTLEQVAVTKWNTLTQADKEAFKQAALEFLITGCKGVLEEPRFIKEKIVQLVVSLAKREWPQNWQQLADLLFEISQKSDQSLELVLYVFRSLAEEYEDLGIPLRRSQELRDGVRANRAKILQLIIAAINTCVERSKDPSQSRVAFALLQSALGAAAANIDLPYKELFESDILPMVCQLVSSGALFPYVLDCLASASEIRKPIDNEFKPPKYAQHMSTVWEATIQAMQVLIAAPEMDDQEDLLCQVVETAAELAGHNLNLLLDKGAETIRMSLMSGLAGLLREAPVYLAEPIVRIWSTILPKASQVFTNPETKREVLIVMFKSQIQRFLLGIDRDDYDSADEYNADLSQLNLMLMRLMRGLAQADLPFAVEVLHTQLRDIANLKPQDNLNSAGLSTKKTTAYKQWDCWLRMLRAAFDEMKNDTALNPQSNENVIRPVIALLESVVSIKSDDPLIADVQMKAATRFWPVLGNNQDAFKVVVQLQLDSLTRFPAPADDLGAASQNEEPRQNLVSLRRNAQSNLISIAKRIPVAFQPIFEDLAKVVFHIVGSTKNADDLSRLLEFLIIVANEMQDAGKRTALYEMMLRDYVDKWSGEKTTGLLSKTENFIGLMQNTEEALHIRQGLKTNLSALTALFRGIASRGAGRKGRKASKLEVVWPLVKQVIPNAINLAQMLAIASVPSTVNALPENLRPIMLSTGRLESLLGNASEFGNTPEGRAKLHIRRTHFWLITMAGEALTLISYATVNQREFYSNNAQQFIQTAFNNMEHMSVEHLRSLIEKLAIPVCRRCKMPEYFGPFLKPVIAHVCTKTGARVEQAVVGRSTESKSEQEEILDEKAAYELSRGFARFLTSIFVPNLQGREGVQIQWRKIGDTVKLLEPFASRGRGGGRGTRGRGGGRRGRRGYRGRGRGGGGAKANYEMSYDDLLKEEMHSQQKASPNQSQSQDDMLSDELCKFLFANEDLLRLVCSNLAMLLHVPSRTTTSLAATTIVRLLRYLANVHAPTSDELQLGFFVEALKATSALNSDAIGEHGRVDVMLEVFKNFANRKNFEPIRNVLRRIPNVVDADITLLKEQSSPKALREKFRHFLGVYVAKNSSVNLTEIQDLPRLYTPPKSQRKQRKAAASAAAPGGNGWLPFGAPKSDANGAGVDGVAELFGESSSSSSSSKNSLFR